MYYLDFILKISFLFELFADSIMCKVLEVWELLMMKFDSLSQNLNFIPYFSVTC